MAEKNYIFRVLYSVSSPRRTSARLGGGEIFTWKIVATPRRREGPPRRGQLCLGEPGDSEGGHSGSPKRSVARLGEPLRLGGGKLHLGGGKLHIGGPTMVRGLCLRFVSGRSRGLICDYNGLLQGPLCDMFECQCVCYNMLICDELLCAMAITWLACLCVIA